MLHLVGTPLHDGGAGDIQPDRINRSRRVNPIHLLLVDVLFHQGGAPTAIFRGPIDPDPSGIEQRLVPAHRAFPAFFRVGILWTIGEQRWGILVEPRTQGVAKPIFLCGKIKIHRQLSRRIALALPDRIFASLSASSSSAFTSSSGWASPAGSG